MRSIRQHLLTRLLSGLALVWVGAGFAVLWTVRSGLGLSIAQACAKALSLTLTAELSTDHTLTFTLRGS